MLGSVSSQDFDDPLDNDSQVGAGTTAKKAMSGRLAYLTERRRGCFVA
jgi:hypothetical protein